LSSDQVQDQVFAAMSDDDRSSLKQDQDQALSSAPPPTATAKTTTKKRSTGLRPLPVTYTEDNIRRQFFRDHPFEAFRARSLTEVGTIENEHPIRGLNWTRLNQRGRNPSPEDAVQFALNLHQAHGLVLSDAYATSIAQFRTLRAVQHVATRFAAHAASAHGAHFGPSATMRGFEAESRVLAANELKSERLDDSTQLARKRWRMIALGSGSGDSGGVGVGVGVGVGNGVGVRDGDSVSDTASDDAANRNAWSRGEEYVRLWKEGIRPDYSPALTEPITPVDTADFMGTRGRR
jgi:small subunit ribosomal protein S23